MAEIKMSYIFITKEIHNQKLIKEILIDIIDNVVEERVDDRLKIDNINAKYRIIQKKGSNRCYFEMIANERVNRSIPALLKIDSAIFKSKEQKYFFAIRDYDGISESFCGRLYPKYAEFERKLRSLILFILTKAYGSSWQEETVSEEMLSAIKKRAHGNISLNETLENMDLDNLETFLFEKREVDYLTIINEELSKELLQKLEKDQICEIIDNMRPTSLWQRHFEKFGSQDKWEKSIQDIHKTRNKVAHQKTISLEEYTDINKKLNKINRDLTNVTENIRKENFTEHSIIDILASFITLSTAITKVIAQSEAMQDVVKSFSEVLKRTKAFQNIEVGKSFAKLGRTYLALNKLNNIQNNIIETTNVFNENIKYIDEIQKNFQSISIAIENKED